MGEEMESAVGSWGRGRGRRSRGGREGGDAIGRFEVE